MNMIGDGAVGGDCCAGSGDAKGFDGGSGGEAIIPPFPPSDPILSICFNPSTAVEEEDDVCGCGDGDDRVEGMLEDTADGAAERICVDKNESVIIGTEGRAIGGTGNDGICGCWTGCVSPGGGGRGA